MVDLNVLVAFFGWCSIINIGILLFTFLFITLFREFTINIHHKLTGMPPDDLPQLYFQYLGIYKIAIFVFNLVPYIALRLVMLA